MTAFFEWLGRVLSRITGFAKVREWFLKILRIILDYPIKHYGCPNSKRTEMLQLKKRLLR